MTDRFYVQALASILDEAVSHNTKESSLCLKMLLYIALNPGCSTHDLGLEFGVGGQGGAVSRNTILLRSGTLPGRRRRSKKRGLVHAFGRGPEPLTYRLTDAGEEYVRRLVRPIPQACQRVLAMPSI